MNGYTDPFSVGYNSEPSASCPYKLTSAANDWQEGRQYAETDRRLAPMPGRFEAPDEQQNEIE